MNLENILGKTLRGGAAPYNLAYSHILDLYSSHQYELLITIISDIGYEFLDEATIILVLKSYIHLYGEEVGTVKGILLLALAASKSIRFKGLGQFSIKIDKDNIIEIICNESFDKDWEKYICIGEGNFQHIFANTDRMIKFNPNIITTLESLCLFLYSCLELYELDSEYYPIYKWLLNLHFKD